MLNTRTFAPGRVAACPAPLGERAASSPGRRFPLSLARYRPAAALGLALACGACARQSAYFGTGSLASSGSATTELATHSLSFTRCGSQGEVTRFERGEVVTEAASPQFTILRIGEHCTVDGVGLGDTFTPDSGALCTLDFREGSRTLRITDAAGRYGMTGGSRPSSVRTGEPAEPQEQLTKE
jgi:hypothetical protein